MYINLSNWLNIFASLWLIKYINLSYWLNIPVSLKLIKYINSSLIYWIYLYVSNWLNISFCLLLIEYIALIDRSSVLFQQQCPSIDRQLFTLRNTSFWPTKGCWLLTFNRRLVICLWPLQLKMLEESSWRVSRTT